MIYSLQKISDGILKSITKASEDLITNASQYLFVNIHSLKLICQPDEQSLEIDTSFPGQ